jgi:hypothetical protein
MKVAMLLLITCELVVHHQVAQIRTRLSYEYIVDSLMHILFVCEREYGKLIISSAIILT